MVFTVHPDVLQDFRSKHGDRGVESSAGAVASGESGWQIEKGFVAESTVA